MTAKNELLRARGKVPRDHGRSSLGVAFLPTLARHADAVGGVNSEGCDQLRVSFEKLKLVGFGDIGNRQIAADRGDEENVIFFPLEFGKTWCESSCDEACRQIPICSEYPMVVRKFSFTKDSAKHQ